MPNSLELGYIIHWKQNVNNVQADSSNGSQYELLQSQKSNRKQEKIMKQPGAI